MNKAISILHVALTTMEHNESINRDLGNQRQAALELETAREIKRALLVLGQHMAGDTVAE